MSHFLVTIQSGQKFTAPAINGAIPRKNHGLPVKIPAVIKARPITMWNGRHIALIFITFTFIIILQSVLKKCGIISKKDYIYITAM